MNLPTDFITTIKPLLGEESDVFLAALRKDPQVSVRLNPLKTEKEPRFSIEAQPVPWSPQGYYLAERPAFTFDPLLHAGYYYVQEASSMFVEHVTRALVNEPAVCLDLCAAPGGKSLSLLAALPPGSLLVSNELIRSRAHILAETLAKAGASNVLVTNNEARNFSNLLGYFDLILVDAPCSGEGMFRKDEVAVNDWSLDNVDACAHRQQEITDHIWPALKPGGVLIYSTCTYNRNENEEVVLKLAERTGAEFIEMPVDPSWGISPALDDRVTGYRFFPHKTRGEGLALFILRKPGLEGEAPTARARKEKKNNPLFLDASPHGRLVSSPETFRFAERGDTVLALPEKHAQQMMQLEKSLKVISMGVELGTRKGRDFIPSHGLALSTHLHPDAYPRYPLSYEQAIAYLRKEALHLDEAPRGVVLVTYNSAPLGFVKNLGNRANNLYPGEWRVRSGYLPPREPRLLELSPSSL